MLTRQFKNLYAVVLTVMPGTEYEQKSVSTYDNIDDAREASRVLRAAHGGTGTEPLEVNGEIISVQGKATATVETDFE